MQDKNSILVVDGFLKVSFFVFNGLCNEKIFGIAIAIPKIEFTNDLKA